MKRRSIMLIRGDTGEMVRRAARVLAEQCVQQDLIPTFDEIELFNPTPEATMIACDLVRIYGALMEVAATTEDTDQRSMLLRTNTFIRALGDLEVVVEFLQDWSNYEDPLRPAILIDTEYYGELLEELSELRTEREWTFQMLAGTGGRLS